MEYNRLVSSTFTILNQESRDMPSSIKSETEPLTWDCYEDRKINLEFPIKREVNIEPNLSTNNRMQFNFSEDREVEIEPSGGRHIQDQALAFYVKEEFELPIKSHRTQPLEINSKFPQTCAVMSESVRQKQDTDFNNLIVANVETMSSSSDSCEGNVPLYSTDIDIFDCDIKAEDTNRLQTSKHSYACTVCCMSFRLKRELKTHAKIHPEKEVPFSNSELIYSQTRNLTRRASIQKKMACSVCDKYFSNKCLLTKHISKHTEELKFSCSVCEKRFSRKCILNLHMLTHSGEKKFSCPVCEKCFLQKIHLNVHMVTHSGEKKFSCSVCGKCFSQKFNLNVHKLTHLGNQYFCSVCDKSFSRNYILKKHMLTH